MNPLEVFLREIRDIRATGAAMAETSFYPSLATLFNTIGKTLKPKVRCVMMLANRGAGMPDGGMFTADQFRKASDHSPREGQLPARGALEVKPPAMAIEETIRSEQIRRYIDGYGLVLVTNLREFQLLGRDAQGNPLLLEKITLAPDEASFWALAAHPQKAADEKGESFCEYISRVILANAPLTDPRDVAWFLASYARDAKARLEKVDLPALSSVRSALEDALGMKFTGEHGEHFFRSTLVQTIFYGVFSAWVLWHRENPGRQDHFDWRMAEWSLHVPFIRALYHQLTGADSLGPLGLVEVLDWTASALDRVDRSIFFEKFQDDEAVQYFYEPFLEAFDPYLRTDLGVWYTPREIVQYQVARIDTVLREELRLVEGLADPNVVVLDPCCGTGAYLVEVLRRIAHTLKERGGDALMAADLKKAAMTRIFGFEILPAPFVVAHLQLGLMLKQIGAPLSVTGHDERVGVFLTNALTGWDPHEELKTLPFPELLDEHKAADKVKREARILVILGNPPYNAFAGVSPTEEQGLVDVYKKGLNAPLDKGGWGIKKFNLDDLYIRFFRLAERRIAEMTDKGVVSFISNFSYLSDPSFVVMRQRFLGEFDKMWFDCLNGDSRETGKLTPEGEPDPSVFSTETNREGIRVGTAIGLLVRKKKRDRTSSVRFRNLWGTDKKLELLESLKAKNINRFYDAASASAENRFSFRPENVSTLYNSWPKMIDLCAVPPSNGLMEKRGGSLIDIDREALARRMKDYFNPDISWGEYSEAHAALTEEQAGFDPKQTRKKAIDAEKYEASRIVRYVVRPFDPRWCYYTQLNPIWNRPRPSLWAQCFKGNKFLMTRPAGVAAPEGSPFFFSQILGDNDFLRGHAYYYPFKIKPPKTQKEKSKIILEIATIPNLSADALRYLTDLKKASVHNVHPEEEIWLHALAIGFSPVYLTENADGIKRDWPRIPFPETKSALEKSAALGERIAALLDTEAEDPGVTAGTIAPFFRIVGQVTRVGGGPLNLERGELALSVGWGHAGKDGAVMPGRGRIETRSYDEAELKAISDAAKAHGLSREQAVSLLGPDTRDIYLNEMAYWKNIPANVWEFYIGGYQVIKKWLSYREFDLLGRSLKIEEIREVTKMACRLAAILLLQPGLDENYLTAKNNSYSWKS